MISGMLLIPLLTLGAAPSADGSAMTGGEMTLSGALTESESGLLEGGRLSLRGKLVADHRTVQAEEIDADLIENDREARRENRRGERQLEVVTVDRRGQMIRHRSESRRTSSIIHQLDLNGDAMIDYVGVDVEDGSVVSLIGREDGSFDVIFGDDAPDVVSRVGESIATFDPQKSAEQGALDEHARRAREVADLIDAIEDVVEEGTGAATDDSTSLVAEFADLDADGSLDLSVSNDRTGEVSLIFSSAEEAP